MKISLRPAKGWGGIGSVRVKRKDLLNEKLTGGDHMDVLQHWDAIGKIFNQALGSCAVATVNPDGSPHVTPIGSLFLQEPGKAFYFEKFPKNMRRNLERDQRVCVMAVTGGLWFIVKALFKGRFDTPPGVRLLGRVSARRMATADEMRRWQEKVKHFRLLKGYNLLWKDMSEVRDITFDSFEPLRLGLMTQGLWADTRE
jgi:hypothetical protein